jgi:serine/threonine protein kinase
MHQCKDSHNIVRILDSFELHDKTYIVTKFAKGGDLLEYCL